MKTIMLILLLLPCYAMAEVEFDLEAFQIDLTTTSRISAAQWDEIERQMEEAIDRATANPPWKEAPVRIVRCTDGSYAVQERWDDPQLGYIGWRVLKRSPGCYPLEHARQLKQDELDYHNYHPAPTVKKPVEVVE